MRVLEYIKTQQCIKNKVGRRFKNKFLDEKKNKRANIWAESQEEVDGRAEQTYLTKINSNEPWDADNATIVNITTDADWNLVQAGAIRFGGEL